MSSPRQQALIAVAAPLLVLLASCGSEDSNKAGQTAAVTACKAQTPPWRATAKKAMEEGQFQYATAIAGNCAEIMGDQEMVQLLADATIKWHVADVKNTSLPAAHRLSTLADLERLSADAAKQFPPTLRQQLARQVKQDAEAQERAARSERKRRGVSLGMTPDEVLQSAWGKPERVNRTTTAHGVSEQWVYGGRNYLYFDNGKLSAIQN